MYVALARISAGIAGKIARSMVLFVEQIFDRFTVGILVLYTCDIPNEERIVVS